MIRGKKSLKVQELRQLLGAADRELVEKAFVESYKKFSKSQKEEVDPLIQDVLAGKEQKRAGKKEAVDFESLRQEIQEFLVNAYAQNYFAPNRVIPKHERPKWRFLVKNYIKELEKVKEEDKDYAESVRLLTELYHLICEACSYYLFSTEDAFRSIGWGQAEFFGVVVRRTFGLGYTRENLSRLLVCACTGGLSRESLHEYQELVLLSECKTSDVKYLLIQEAMKLVAEWGQKQKTLGKHDLSEYELREGINEFCGMVLITSATLGEWEDGVKYYFEKCRESGQEVVLYTALRRIEDLDEDEIWLRVYEFGVKNKIKPRESLQRRYEERKADRSGQTGGNTFG